VDISRGEMVESDLDRLIERRDTERRKSEGERAREQLWVESVRCYHERQAWVATDGFAYPTPEWAAERR
jgi:hypothetical protein